MYVMAICAGLLALLSGCSEKSMPSSAPNETADVDRVPERQRALTISGPTAAVDELVQALSSKRHEWTMSPVQRDASITSVRFRWKNQPNYRDLGGIIYLAQSKGLAILDTDLIEQ